MKTLNLDNNYYHDLSIVLSASGATVPARAALDGYMTSGGLITNGHDVEGGPVVGFIAWRPGNVVQIDALVVHPDYRGLGIGFILLDEALNYFRANSDRAVAYLADYVDADGIEWLSQFGFCLMRESPRKDKRAMCLANVRTEATRNRIAKFLG